MANKKEKKDENCEDLLKCGVCLKRYRRPKLLPCFHTYCQRCVETLAGAKPSFPCPACRTIVVIPPGGAANLQANFYLERDLVKEEAREGTECELCSEGRQAQFKCVQCQQLYCSPCRGLHDAIESCSQHTILPANEGEGGGEDGASESKCPKHKNQLLLLFCCRCEVAICIQCKLTSHDGHETEDVQDTGAKAKAQLQEESDLLDQRRQLLEAVLAKAEDFYDDLEKEKQAAEQEIRERAKQLQQMVTEAQEEALNSVQNVTQAAVDAVKQQVQPIKERQAAVVGKRQHIQQVIDEGNAEQAVGMVNKLRGEAENTNKGKSELDNLFIQRSTVGVGRQPRAVRYTNVLSFIGMAKEGPPVETKPSSLEAFKLQVPVQHRLKMSRSQFALRVRAAGDSGPCPYREIIYSNNPNSYLHRMSLTSDGGMWLVYNPGGSVYLMSLFSDDGECLETVYEDALTSTPLITCDGDALVSLQNPGYWVRPGGERGTLETPLNRGGATVSKSAIPYLLWPNGNARIVLRARVESLPPEIDNNPVCTYNVNGTYQFDVSADGRFYAFCSNPLTVFDKIQSSATLRQFAVYKPPDGSVPNDVCFCEVEGREMLLVAYYASNSLHVVDHRDGCCFVRRLDSDVCKLDRPQQLATNHQGRVWVGCYGGKIVCFDL